MEQLNQNQQVQEFTEQIKTMFKSFEESQYKISDYYEAVTYFLQMKESHLQSTLGIMSVQQVGSEAYEILKEKTILQKDSIRGLNSVKKFFESIFSSNIPVRPINQNCILVSSYSLMYDLTDFHTFRFDFENGDPVEVAFKYAILKERLDHVREFLSAL